MDGATNALELRLDAIENELREMRAEAQQRDVLLLRSVDAVEKFLAGHEGSRQLEARLVDVSARLGQIELLCPECPRRTPAPTPLPGGSR